MSTFLKSVGGRIAVLVLVAGAFAGYYALTQDKTEKDIQADLPKVGDCYSMSGDEKDADIKERKCDDDKALHRAIAIIGDDDKETCDDFFAYSTFEASVSNNGVEVKSSVCGVPNLAVGDCVDGETFDRTACTETPGQAKVTKFVDVKSEEEALDEAVVTAACGAESDWMPFVVDKKVACLSVVA